MPRRPSTAGPPIFSSTSAFRIASVISVFAGLHLPVRTSAGAIFSNVSGKSIMTNPFGFSLDEPAGLAVEGRLRRVPRDLRADLAAELRVLRDEELPQRDAERVVAGADVHRRSSAERPDGRLREHAALEASEARIRQR